ncbi:MAG: cell division protein PerM [Nocardioides sp.]
MTSLFSPGQRLSPPSPAAGPPDTRHHRPLALVAALGGLVAAAGPLTVLCAIGVIGWFVADAGVHGAPRDGLRVAALAWLAAHGSGVFVAGTHITVIPLGITAMCAWVCWRLGHRVGDSVSGYGPDASGIIDGQRDWTVPMATTLFGAAYLTTITVVGLLVTSRTSDPSLETASWGAIAISVVFGGAGIATGSGRAAIWLALSEAGPMSVLRPIALGARAILVGYLWLAAGVVAAALASDFGTAATIVSRLHADTGDTALFVLALGTLLPNAVLFGGAYLLGPGFAVGTGTVVSPTLVAIGPLPLLPFSAALPDAGTGSWLTRALIALPVVVAACAVARTFRAHPTTRWSDGLSRGAGAGVVAGIGFAVLAAWSGGSAGPGRMREVAPFAGDVLAHGVTLFGLGGLLGGLAMTWWCRRLLSQ